MAGAQVLLGSAHCVIQVTRVSFPVGLCLLISFLLLLLILFFADRPRPSFPSPRTAAVGGASTARLLPLVPFPRCFYIAAKPALVHGFGTRIQLLISVIFLFLTRRRRGIPVPGARTVWACAMKEAFEGAV